MTRACTLSRALFGFGNTILSNDILRLVTYMLELLKHRYCFWQWFSACLRPNNCFKYVCSYFNIHGVTAKHQLMFISKSDFKEMPCIKVVKLITSRHYITKPAFDGITINGQNFVSFKWYHTVWIMNLGRRTMLLQYWPITCFAALITFGIT